jgi:hypothetical protein
MPRHPFAGASGYRSEQLLEGTGAVLGSDPAVPLKLEHDFKLLQLEESTGDMLKRTVR